MSHNLGRVALAGLLILAIGVLGWWTRRGHGEVRTSVPTGRPAWLAELAEAGIILDPAGTLLQFSNPVCAPCSAARNLINRLRQDGAQRPGGVSRGDSGELDPGEAGQLNLPTALARLGYLEVDLQSRGDLLRAFEIRQAPTFVVLDAEGHELARLAGPLDQSALARLIAPAVAPQTLVGSVG